MEIRKEKVVSITYELRKDGENGEVVETVTGDNPLTFLYGVGGMLPKFEENLDGMRAGDEFRFGLNSEDAYGPVVENAVVDVPIDVFKVDGQVDHNMLQIGNMVPMMDNSGNRLNGKIIDIQVESVKMDFNHPMAGKNLYFSGSIAEVRDATDEELAHGHVHGHGGCNDGGCNDKEGHSCSCGH
jgi:FKBP-type peptidyl-prolyl cis-trans isomerase SlyD